MGFWSGTAGGKLYTIVLRKSRITASSTYALLTKTTHNKHCKSAEIKKKICLNRSPENSKLKVKQSRYRPGVAQRVPGS